MFVISLYKPYFSANSSVCLIITLPKPHPLKVLSTITTKTPRKIINNIYGHTTCSTTILNHHPQLSPSSSINATCSSICSNIPDSTRTDFGFCKTLERWLNPTTSRTLQSVETFSKTKEQGRSSDDRPITSHLGHSSKSLNALALSDYHAANGGQSLSQRHWPVITICHTHDVYTLLQEILAILNWEAELFPQEHLVHHEVWPLWIHSPFTLQPLQWGNGKIYYSHMLYKYCGVFSPRHSN